MKSEENLKAARERVARGHVRERFADVCDQDNMDECPACSARVDEEQAALRELQRQAMVAAIRHVAALHIKHYGRELGVKCYSAAEVDWVLDAPTPAYPVRCIHCGQIEEAHAIVAHDFEAQSPQCHRAHPHEGPCAPALEERERQAAAEARGWDTTGGGDE